MLEDGMFYKLFFCCPIENVCQMLKLVKRSHWLTFIFIVLQKSFYAFTSLLCGRYVPVNWVVEYEFNNCGSMLFDESVFYLTVVQVKTFHLCS